MCDYGCDNEGLYQLKNGKWCCSKHCSSCPAMKKKNSNKIKALHDNGLYFDVWKGHTAWNKGLTKETDERVKKNGQTLSENIKSGKTENKSLGRKHSEETKQKLSEKMKIAHEEGRAWNIGKSRWNNEPSWPETFFMKVIENEFNDKNFIREFPMSIYSLDFAWEHKKKCIEIDGEQHQRFEEYVERDKRKDICIVENGWKVLRISWKEMYNNTKEYIKIAKEFIDD